MRKPDNRMRYKVECKDPDDPRGWYRYLDNLRWDQARRETYRTMLKDAAHASESNNQARRVAIEKAAVAFDHDEDAETASVEGFQYRIVPDERYIAREKVRRAKEAVTNAAALKHYAGQWRRIVRGLGMENVDRVELEFRELISRMHPLHGEVKDIHDQENDCRVEFVTGVSVHIPL